MSWLTCRCTITSGTRSWLLLSVTSRPSTTEQLDDSQERQQLIYKERYTHVRFARCLMSPTCQTTTAFILVGQWMVPATQRCTSHPPPADAAAATTRSAAAAAAAAAWCRYRSALLLYASVCRHCPPTSRLLVSRAGCRLRYLHARRNMSITFYKSPQC